MKLLIGTSEGLFSGTDKPEPVAAEGLGRQCVRVLRRVNGSLFAGSDVGVFRSRDGGRSWKLSAAEGKIVWEIVSGPDDNQVLYAGTQPPALFRTRDGGDSWSEIGPLTKAQGSERWCVPNSDLGARARAIALDRRDPSRYWVGLEVGGVLETKDDGGSWSCVEPGGDPDIHMMVADPGKDGVLYATTGYGRMDNSQPMAERIAGLFGSTDGGRSWEYLWGDLQPRYTRPMCIDSRAPYALTVGCAPRANSSVNDPGGAHSMLYQRPSADSSWRSLGDADHSPSAANILSVNVDEERAGGVLVGTDTGEIWRVSPEAEWTLLASGLPMVQAVLQV